MNEAVNGFTDRLARIETKLDIMVSLHKEDLVELKRSHTELQKEFHGFKSNLNEKIAWVAGSFAVLATGGVYLIKWFLKLA